MAGAVLALTGADEMEIKYKVGDKVWYASTTTTQKTMPCPDCLDTKKWKGISPAGNEYEFPCPRCCYQHGSWSELSLTYAEVVPYVRSLTIGSVRTDSSEDIERQVSYMCEETGVGSGTIYYQPQLHTTEESARIASELDCKIRQADTPYIVERMKNVQAVASCQLSNADMVQAGRVRKAARYALQDFIDSIRHLETIEAVQEKIESFEA